MENPRLWEPDFPYLYEAQVSLSVGGTVKDTAVSVFGMRSFAEDMESVPRGMFYLNGKSIRLRGANTMGYEQQDVLRGDFDMLLYDEPVPLVSPHFNGRADIVFQPLTEPVYVLHVSSKTGDFYSMAVRHALGLYTSHLLAALAGAEAKRMFPTQQSGQTEIKGDDGAGVRR